MRESRRPPPPSPKEWRHRGGFHPAREKEEYHGGASVTDLAGKPFLLEVSRMFWKEGRELRRGGLGEKEAEREREGALLRIAAVVALGAVVGESLEVAETRAQKRGSEVCVCVRTLRFEARSLDRASWIALGSLDRRHFEGVGGRGGVTQDRV